MTNMMLPNCPPNWFRNHQDDRSVIPGSYRQDIIANPQPGVCPEELGILHYLIRKPEEDMSLYEGTSKCNMK